MQGLHHENVSQALNVVEEALEEAKNDGKWMVVVWSCDGDKVHLRTRTTWEFPRSDIGIAMRLLRETLREDEPAPEPLPAAKFIEMALKNKPEEGEEDNND